MPTPSLQHKAPAWLLLVAGILLLQVAMARSDGGFEVLRAATELVDGVYHLDADVRYRFSDAVQEALHSGVPLTIEMEIQVVHPRNWVWDAGVAALYQQYRLKYHALTGQYIVTNLNSGVQSSYPTQPLALRALGSVAQLPLIDRRLLAANAAYEGRLRVQLLLSTLPSPLRLWAYLSPEWWQKSQWYTWKLQ